MLYLTSYNADHEVIVMFLLGMLCCWNLNYLTTYNHVVYVGYSVMSASATSVAMQSGTFGVDIALFVSSLLASSLGEKYRIYCHVDSYVFWSCYVLSEFSDGEHLKCFFLLCTWKLCGKSIISYHIISYHIISLCTVFIWDFGIQYLLTEMSVLVYGIGSFICLDTWVKDPCCYHLWSLVQFFAQFMQISTCKRMH